ncbi:hypothetical protein DPMN_120529 [Dreissena polymorpha]|uniref:Uncharacterized protein n=1 Tax=Dreissena polymorpha TaxID=45954 RepID=A0A9D4GNG6_DREPO|nr:hypothetical protein DPMN_120529 [Dreissena polymorpha]
MTPRVFTSFRTDTQTDRQTDRQTDKRTDSATAKCHPTGGIKNNMRNGSIGKLQVVYAKTAPSRGSNVFQKTVTIKILGLDIIKTNVVSKFHKDLTTNMTSRVSTRKTTPPAGGQYIIRTKVLKLKTAQPPCGHDYQQTVTIFKLSRAILRPYLNINLTSRVFTRKTAAPPGGHVFLQTEPMELSRDIIGTNNLITFHEDLTLNVTSMVLARKTALPPGRHVFQRSGTIFELS